MSEFELHVEDALDESLLRKLHQQKGTPGVLQRLIEMDFTTLGELCNLESSLAKEFKIPIILMSCCKSIVASLAASSTRVWTARLPTSTTRFDF